MDPTPPRIHPEDVAIPKLVAESRVDDNHCSRYEAPTAHTDAFAGAAGADGVVVGHVDIKDEFALQGDQATWTDSLLVTRL